MANNRNKIHKKKTRDGQKATTSREANYLLQYHSIQDRNADEEDIENDSTRRDDSSIHEHKIIEPLPPEQNVHLKINRPLLTVPEKHQKYKYSKPIKQGFGSKLKEGIKSEFECSTDRVKKKIFLRLPIIEWALKYDLQKGLLGDVIAGITVAVMHIPQGMAYALLANVDPIVGIYMAFFPVLTYAFFASSRHLSMGTFAVICLMTGKTVSELATFPEDNGVVGGMTTMAGDMSTTMMPSNITTTMMPSNITTTDGYSPIEVATIVSFGVSVWMFLFGLLNLGSLCVFLSDMLVSGFTTGAAVHVFTSQVKSLFGVTIKSYNGVFKIILTWGAIFKNILDSNPATMVISMVCIIVLLFNNEVIKPRLRKVTMIPIPIELIVVIVGTLASRYGHLNENFDIVIVGEIPTGLPPPTLPPFDLYGQVVLPSFIISLVSYSISFSMAKIFATKNDYTVDATQELYANGFGNLVGSLFQCAPMASSLSRTLIQVNVGGYSQLTSFISCGIVVLVLLFIGPFFETLPNCVLASIIVTALKGMFMQFGDFKRMLKISKIEAAVWMITFLGVVIIDIDYGLFIGIGLSLLLLLGKNQSPSVVVMGRVPDTDIYLDRNRYASVVDISDVKICQISGPLHYANAESLRQSIIRVSGLDPRYILKMKKKKEKAVEKLHPKTLFAGDLKKRKNSLDKKDPEIASVDENEPKINGRSPSEDTRIKDIEKRFMSLEMPDVNILILDYSGVNQMDITSAKNTSLLYSDYAAAGIQIYFAGFAEKCLETLVQSGVSKDIPENRFFHSIHDVIMFLDPTKSTKIIEDNISNYL